MDKGSFSKKRTFKGKHPTNGSRNKEGVNAKCELPETLHSLSDRSALFLEPEEDNKDIMLTRLSSKAKKTQGWQDLALAS